MGTQWQARELNLADGLEVFWKVIQSEQQMEPLWRTRLTHEAKMNDGTYVLPNEVLRIAE
jgi:hypothetical protein